MKIIIPMAGRGSRLRPHTLTVPKPLIPIAGKPIVHQLVEDIAELLKQDIEEIAFIIHKDFGNRVEEDLKTIARKAGAKGSIYYQEEPLGTAHAIMSARPAIEGPVVIAYADTLFKADFTLDPSADSIIWVKQVDNPAAFGVVTLNSENQINGFVEKPKENISDLAIIGIYYFKEGATLRSELQNLLDNQLTRGGEYQLTDALIHLLQKGMKFVPGKVTHWMDCGNKAVTIETNSKMLEFLYQKGKQLVAHTAVLNNARIIPPCYIGEHVQLKNATIGPYVSIGDYSLLENATLRNSLIQTHTHIKNAQLTNAMIGNHVIFDGNYSTVSLGDYSELI